jgi:hypothetical protein
LGMAFWLLWRLQSLISFTQPCTSLNGEYPTYFWGDGWHKRKGTLWIKCCTLFITLKKKLQKVAQPWPLPINKSNGLELSSQTTKNDSHGDFHGQNYTSEFGSKSLTSTKTHTHISKNMHQANKNKCMSKSIVLLTHESHQWASMHAKPYLS